MVGGFGGQTNTLYNKYTHTPIKSKPTTLNSDLIYENLTFRWIVTLRLMEQISCTESKFSSQYDTFSFLPKWENVSIYEHSTTQVLLEFTYITCIRISNVHSWLLGHICKLWESSGSSFFKISLILMFQLWNSFVHIFLCCKSMSELFAFLFSILKIKCQNVRYSFSEVNLCLVNLTKVSNESFKVLFFWRHLLGLWKIIQKERGNRQNWTGISLSFLLLLCIISFITF